MGFAAETGATFGRKVLDAVRYAYDLSRTVMQLLMASQQ